MEPKPKFDPKFPLGPDLAIDSAGLHLYRIRLTRQKVPQYSNDNNNFRRIVIMMIVYLLCFIRSTVSFCLTDDYMQLFFFMGDWPAFIPGIRYHVNIDIMSVLIVSLYSHLIYYQYDHKKSKLFGWFSVFEVICGENPPICVGLDDEADVRKLISRTKILFMITKISRKGFVFINKLYVCLMSYKNIKSIRIFKRM